MWSGWLWCLRGIHVVAFGYLWCFVEIVVSQILCRGMDKKRALFSRHFSNRFFVKRAAFDVKVGRCAVVFGRKSTLERSN